MARGRTAAFVALLAGAAVVGLAAPARATFTTNEVGCSGHATITGKNGKTYEVDAKDDEVKVPKDGTAAWQGAVTTVTHNHRGSVQLKLAFWGITLGSWGPSANAGGEPMKKGTKEIPSAVSLVPPGKYVVSGSHRGTEGGCSGNVTVEIEGSIFGSPVGIVSLGGTVLSALGLAVAAKARRP